MPSNAYTPATQTPLLPLAVRLGVAANLIGISPRKLWQMTRDGLVPHVRLGRVIVYPLAAIEKWLSEQAKNGGTP